VNTKKINIMQISLFVAIAIALTLVLSPTGALAKETKGTKSAKSDKKEVVDLNNASQKELETLSGIGAAAAKKIIAGRPYRSVDELSRAGLSAKKIEALKSQVMVGSAPAAAPAPSDGKTGAVAAPAQKISVQEEKPAASSKSKKLAPGQWVNINTASKEELEVLPGIGPAKSQAIIDGRPYSAIEDVMKVKGIKQGIFNKIKDNITVR
jgi:competence protein ComEA